MAAQEGSILPLEMLQEIFSYLDMQELDTIVAPVCRLWRDASRLPVVRRRLTLTNKISLRAAQAIMRRSPQLKELKISYEYLHSYTAIDYTDDVLRAAATYNQKLRVLYIRSEVSDIVLEAVAQYDQLRSLTLHKAPEVTDEGIVHLARLNLLEKLQLRYAGSVTAAGWNRLFSTCEWPHLRALTLKLYHAEEDEVPQVHFERLPITLRSIELHGYVSDMDLEAVAQCDQLRSLSLHNMHRVTDDGVVHLARLNLLEKLTILCAYSVTPAGWNRLLSICEWPHLRELRLVLCQGDKEPQVRFERPPTSLRSLELWGLVPDVDFEAVSQCTELRTLILCLPMPNRIADQCLLHLARLRHLEKLVLDLGTVTPAGCRRLFSMCDWPHLRELRLPSGARNLIPEAKLHFPNAEIC